jgi:NAD(P)H-dependent FMN reductase
VELKRRVREANALFVTPACNYSVPGVLKNAIDWAVIATVAKRSALRLRPS